MGAEELKFGYFDPFLRGGIRMIERPALARRHQTSGRGPIVSALQKKPTSWPLSIARQTWMQAIAKSWAPCLSQLIGVPAI